MLKEVGLAASDVDVRDSPATASTSISALIGDVQSGAASLAVNRIRFVALQAAGRAGKAHLVGPEQNLGEAQEQGHTADHHDDGDQPSAGPL